MVSEKAVKQAVRALSQVPTSTQRLSTSDFTTEDSVAGERSRIATHQFERPVVLKEGEPFDVDLVAYESKTTDGTAGNSETFNLGHDLIDSPSIPNDLVLYEGGNRVQPDSVDYANDSFTYTDDGMSNTLHVFYASGDQAHLEFRKTAPNGVYETLASFDVGLVNQRNQNKSPLEFEFDHPLQGTIPTSWSLDIYVDGPYVIDWGIDTDGDGTDEATPTNQLVSVPTRVGQERVPEWASDVVAQLAATR